MVALAKQVLYWTLIARCGLSFQCTSDYEFGPVVAPRKKGLALDDATIRDCASAIPRYWPNTVEPVTSLRLFSAWKREWPEADRDLAWRSLRVFLETNRATVLVGTQITCDEAADDEDWRNTLQLLELLGPAMVMGVGIGNEVELLYTKGDVDQTVTGECIRRLWGGGFWHRFTDRVRQLDELGFNRVPITTVLGGLALSSFSGQPFFERPGKALVNSFLTNASKRYGRRFVFTLNLYAYFEPEAAVDLGTLDQCKTQIMASTCWKPECFTPSFASAVRRKMEQLTGSTDGTFWIGETGWSSPKSSTLGTAMMNCEAWSSNASLSLFYEGFLQWDLQLGDGLRSADHIFYFTARDSDNYGAAEHFGLVESCLHAECKLRSENFSSPNASGRLEGPVAGLAESPRLAYCTLPGTVSAVEARHLYLHNCRKVAEASREFQRLFVVSSAEPLLTGALGFMLPASFNQRLAEAENICYQAKVEIESPGGQLRLAALLAVNAWASVMGGRLCCGLDMPPFCTNGPKHNREVHVFSFQTSLLLLGISLLLLRCYSYIKVKRRASAKSYKQLRSMRARGPKFPGEWYVPDERPVRLSQLSRGESRDELSTGAAAVATAVGSGGAKRVSVAVEELETLWLDGSPLRVLPNAQRWAARAARLFASLQEVFGFQANSVSNQFEHLLSLWRSHCASVAMPTPTHVALGVARDDLMLERALADLHSDLLEGFHKWRARLQAYERAGVDNPEGVPLMGGAKWVLLRRDEDWTDEQATQLAEIAVYLLVWGEAGNVRFVPEALYFFVELVLAAEVPAHSAVSTRARFLTGVIRPLYNVIFDEWHDSVDVDPVTGRDVKRLKHGYERFLPPECANYDDWNELFCDPERLVDALVLEDGRTFFGAVAGHQARYAALWHLDWGRSLAAHSIKTHQECHGFLGAFAATHRVWFVHGLLFLTSVSWVVSQRHHQHDQDNVCGFRDRLAAAALVVPLHAAFWLLGRHRAHGAALRAKSRGLFSGRYVLSFLPLASFASLRFAGGVMFEVCWLAHIAISVVGAWVILFPEVRHGDALWDLTETSCSSMLLRYAFWAAIIAMKFVVGYVLVDRTDYALEVLEITRLESVPASLVPLVAWNPTFNNHVIEWFLLWLSAWLTFLADTQLWFTLACVLLGQGIDLWQKGLWNVIGIEDEVAKIPERFSRLLLPCDPWAMEVDDGSGPGRNKVGFSASFPIIWDRIVQYMLHEDKIDSSTVADLAFVPSKAGRFTSWEELLQEPFAVPKGATALYQNVREPHIFFPRNIMELTLRRGLGVLEDRSWPGNVEVQWRLQALAHCLTLPIPRPYRPPHIPGMTVLIPHYSEDILVSKSELLASTASQGQVVPLIDWLESRYPDEFRAFLNRMAATAQASGKEWPCAGRNWDSYEDEQWQDICLWASMRSQTLWRTVAGMSLYYPALRCHFDTQREARSLLAEPGVWKCTDCFMCLVAMQRYAFFGPAQLEQTDRLLEQFPGVSIAFVDHDLAKGEALHPQQLRRYYSCLIDRNCPVRADGRRVPRLRIELPGYPILGDGKADNQNHAIHFTRGSLLQCIDANQGGYFEQALMLPCLLREFSKEEHTGGHGAKQIIGLPEHITSDFGSIGDFGASAEFAFGTILQRVYASLGVRMHYGHPDFMNKVYMMQQGGVSKATKTLNLSEDIFAGMDFVLRGGGRCIRHCEYLNVSKGRDMGFNALLKFVSKVSSGNGEQLITRQVMRLGDLLPLPDALSFFYAHFGFYATQCLLTFSTPLLAVLFLLVILNECEPSFEVFNTCQAVSGRPTQVQHVATVLTSFSYTLVVLVLVNTLPLFAAFCAQGGLTYAVARVTRQFLTLSPVYFTFQSKIVCSCLLRELRCGGATYIDTGRGLPTQRRPFIGPLPKGGLYLDYASHALYSGAKLLVVAVCPWLFARSFWHHPVSVPWQLQLWLTIGSWLLAPFLFNPYQFSQRHFREDVEAWREFFLDRGGAAWADWYREVLCSMGGDAHTLLADVFHALLIVVAWFTTLNAKLHVLTALTDHSRGEGAFAVFHALALCPPVFLPWLCAAFFSCPCMGEEEDEEELGCSQCRCLPSLAVAVSLLEVLEVLISLGLLLIIGWNRTFVVGVLLKYAMLDVLTDLCEAMHQDLGHRTMLWLLARRMMRDIVTSLLVFALLAPLVGLAAINDWLCPGCSLHHLLIYRWPGDMARKTMQLRKRSSYRSPFQRPAVPTQPLGHCPCTVMAAS